jgi:hypothetical protein
MPNRVLFADPAENIQLFSGLRRLGDGNLGQLRLIGRKYADLWLFWHSIPRSPLTDTTALKRLRAADADQHGRFYLATTSAPALFQLDPSHGVKGSISELSRESLTILERHKVLTRY